MSSMKIVCLGDSLTQGYNLPIESRWTNLLDIAIKGTVINCGINGDTTAGMLSRLPHVLAQYIPSHIIILGGTNDLWFGLPDIHIIANIHAIIRQAKSHGIIPIVGIPTSIIHTNEENILKQNYSERMSQFQTALKAYCISDNQLHIPFNKNMMYHQFLDDGLHPNTEGQQIMKEHVLSLLTKIL